MNTMGQMGQLDGQIFAEGMAEVGALVEEQVTVKRFVDITAGDPALGIGATENYTTFQTTMLMEYVTAQEINFTNSIYAAGDVRGQCAIQIFGEEGAAGGDAQAANRRSDQVIWRGRTYRVIGHVDRIHYGGQYYWTPVLRQRKSA